MALAAGSKLGPYEIVAPVGAGGMGEVYRARDTRLNRDVALKVLPDAFARDGERMARLRREAQVLASLNHPNIAAIYGFEDSGATRALVMELVDGPTLAERIKAGAIPLDEALPIAKQICEAVEYAHERGIMHRDLKPSNITIAQNDAVKILDFGLAKAIEGDPASMDISSSPTISRMATHAGIILGTAAYMSPEQAKGKSVDRRTDIWAFGCVFYEMLTGERAFSGETVTDTLAAILKSEPDWSRLPSATPAHVRVLLRRCLQKDPRQRLQAIGDARIALEEVLSGVAKELVASAVRVPIRQRAVPWMVAAALLAIVAALFATGYFLRAPVDQPAIRASIKPAANASITSYNGGTAGFAISPDGLRVTYVALGQDGRSLLWVRPMDSLQAQPLEGTEGASIPFWSPDSRFIGFFAGGKLKKIEASGGPPLVLADAPRGRGATWSRDGTILFAPFISTPLFRVSAAGGNAASVTTLNPSIKESTHRWPYFLPDGRHFLYLAGNPLTPAGSPTNSVMVGSLDSKETKFLFHSHSNALYASGRILFLRQNTLMAQLFDTKHLELIGDAVPVAENVEDVAPRVQGSFSASENGILAYLEAGGTNRQLLWFDRSGKQVGAVPGVDTYSDPQISPDGKRVAFVLESPATDVWLYDIARGVKTRFTFGSGNESPRWSPDGSRIAYTSVRTGQFGIYAKAADGSGHEELLVPPGPEQVYPVDWSPDGKLLAYFKWELSTTGEPKLRMLPLNGREPYIFNDLEQSTSCFSPDGKWLAYSSTESGRSEVYVTPFPGPGGKWQISTEGGTFPQWRHDGSELFYMAQDNNLMSAQVKANGSSFVVGTVKAVFQTKPYFGLFTATPFAATADGQRFIIPYDSGQANRTISLVVNWPALLKKQ